MCSLEVDIVDNSNISKECLDKKVLHLNPRRSGKITINLIKIDKKIEVGSWVIQGNPKNRKKSSYSKNLKIHNHSLELPKYFKG